MKLTELPKGHFRAVFSDLDGTLTKEGRLPSTTFEALYRLKDAGYWLVLVSGRPAGWADCLMRLWPLDAMVFENGAGIMINEGQKICVSHLAKVKDLQAQKAILERIYQRLKGKLPKIKLATDQPYRLFDYAIDFCEEPPNLSEKEVQWVLGELAKEKEITAKLSSIHVNYWVGTHTKVTACERLLEKEGKRRGIAQDQVLFVGDSPNDEPLFGYFPHSVGVANISRFLPVLKSTPTYLASKSDAGGFEEMVEILLR